MKASVPDQILTLLREVPEQDRPDAENECEFWRAVTYEMSELLRHAARAQSPQVVFNPVRCAGSQYIWEFYVNDLDTPRKFEFNWHGQNTSQWLYAGCILLEGGRVSTHH